MQCEMACVIEIREWELCARHGEYERIRVIGNDKDTQ